MVDIHTKLTTVLCALDPVSIVAYLSVFFDTYLPGVNHMRNIAMRVSNHLSNCEAALHSHVNGLLSAAVSIQGVPQL